MVVYVAAGKKKMQKNTRAVARSSSKATVKVASASRTGNRAVKGRAAPHRANKDRVASAR